MLALFTASDVFVYLLYVTVSHCADLGGDERDDEALPRLLRFDGGDDGDDEDDDEGGSLRCTRR